YAPVGEAAVDQELAAGRWARIRATPLGESGETVLTLHDITEQRALEDAKSLFLATTSHELKTPLTVISGFAATLRYRWHQLDDNQRIEALEAITRRSETLLRLIERLLISSQADVGNLYVLTEPVDLGAALREAVAGLDAVSEHRIVVQVPETDPPVTVLADPRALEQIVGQLLENAFKYSPPGREVRLEIVLKEGLAVERDVDDV